MPYIAAFTVPSTSTTYSFMNSHLRLAEIIGLLLFAIAYTHAEGSSFYVSPSGSDSWSGQLPSSNKEKTDGPFATLERARDAVRAWKATRGPSGDTVVVYLRKGNYSLQKSLHLNMQDGGSSGKPVVWRSYPGEKVFLTGSRTIEGFTKVSDRSALQRIQQRFRDRILQIELSTIGITDYGKIMGRGGPGMELFFDGKRMPIARYPNSGWLNIEDVPQSGDTLYNRGLDREKRFKDGPVGRHYGKFQYSGNRPDLWSSENEISVHGYWTWDWSDSYQKVQSIDAESKTITIAPPHHHYGYTTNQRFYFLNILEELDTPGEWYLDRTNGVLYFWPPGPMRNGSVTVSMLDAPLISLDSASYLTIRDLNFGYSRNSGIIVSGGDHCVIGGCSFSFLGGDAVVLNNGSENGITGCDIFDVAVAGVMLGGGDRQTLMAGKNFATNNNIHDYSRWIRTGQYAINIS
ncbi:MAG: right-handed parallel beta-helix repeat-containing protein, partial [Ignavibacteriae bacterium]|nr:right-handed parallel beta-helix repeat-containing protein [Ignavibacteriota bacterium]